MSLPTLTPEEYRKIQDANKKPSDKVKEVTRYITHDVPVKVSGVLESLAFLLIAFLYFTFTGLAILLKRKLPPFWEELARPLEAGRISGKVEQVKKATEKMAKAGKIKVVDMETGKRVV